MLRFNSFGKSIGVCHPGVSWHCVPPGPDIVVVRLSGTTKIFSGQPILKAWLSTGQPSDQGDISYGQPNFNTDNQNFQGGCPADNQKKILMSCPAQEGSIYLDPVICFGVLFDILGYSICRHLVLFYLRSVSYFFSCMPPQIVCWSWYGFS